MQLSAGAMGDSEIREDRCPAAAFALNEHRFCRYAARAHILRGIFSSPARNAIMML